MITIDHARAVQHAAGTQYNLTAVRAILTADENLRTDPLWTNPEPTPLVPGGVA
jgi:hypothetical protein